jgi:hypothetical protein
MQEAAAADTAGTECDRSTAQLLRRLGITSITSTHPPPARRSQLFGDPGTLAQKVDLAAVAGQFPPLEFGLGIAPRLLFLGSESATFWPQPSGGANQCRRPGCITVA